MFHRLLKLPKSNSFFLFGARGTGKSTLLSESFDKKKALWIDLLDPNLESRLTRDPSQLREIWQANKKPWVVIDEVQKIPKLLDVVHSMIEKEKVFFALTGSSARKLKQGQANLLAGRAWAYSLYPLSVKELEDAFNLEDALNFGTLPTLYKLKTDSEKIKYLNTYANTYIKEEVQMEQLVRAIDSFRKFLPIAAFFHAKPLNFAKIGRDSGVDAKNVERYFSILEDTLLGFYLDAFHRSVRKRQKLSPKFYFFDVGVQRALAETLDVRVAPQTSYYGEIFEAFIISEIFRRRDYSEKSFKLSYLQSHDGLEVDLVVEKASKVLAFVEIKSAQKVDEMDLGSLTALKDEFPKARRICLCQEKTPRVTKSGIEILPWQLGIEELLDI